MKANEFLHKKDVAYMNRLSTSLDFDRIVSLMEEYATLRIHDVSESVCELCNGTEIFNPFDGMELPCACTTKIVEQTDR